MAMVASRQVWRSYTRSSYCSSGHSCFCDLRHCRCPPDPPRGDNDDGNDDNDDGDIGAFAQATSLPSLPGVDTLVVVGYGKKDI